MIELRDVFVMVMWGSTSRCCPCVQLLLQLFSSHYAISYYEVRLSIAARRVCYIFAGYVVTCFAICAYE